MTTADTREPDFDIVVVEDRGLVGLLGVTFAAMRWCEENHHLGEPFGNGLILSEEMAYQAFELLDAVGLITRTY